MTSAGEVSSQCDIVIVDRSAPRIQDLQSHRIIPAECVFGVIEVKPRLTGSELVDSCEKIAKVKRLTRKAYAYAQLPTLHPQRITIIPPPPIFGYTFAFEGIKPENLVKKFREWFIQNPREEHADGIWIADCGMIVWGSSNGLGSWYPVLQDPQLGREIRLLGTKQDGNILLGIIMSICSLLIRPLPPLDLTEYLSGGIWYWVRGRVSLTPDPPSRT